MKSNFFVSFCFKLLLLPSVSRQYFMLSFPGYQLWCKSSLKQNETKKLLFYHRQKAQTSTMILST